jgi:hypothetical protein
MDMKLRLVQRIFEIVHLFVVVVVVVLSLN